jgi:hypothetical protein
MNSAKMSDSIPTIPSVKVKPEVPHGYLFDDLVVKDFILAKSTCLLSLPLILQSTTRW